MKIIYTLEKHHLMQLHRLYQKEWWTENRTLEETQKAVEHSQVVIGLVDENNELQAFVRVLTDYMFKALIFDLIVSEEHRSKGLGKKLINLVQNHIELKATKHFELYCLPEMVSFYEAFDFSDKLGKLVLMRKG